MSDTTGLDRAYANVNRVHFDDNTKTLYLSGTDPTNPTDLYADATIPFGVLHTTDRYAQLEQLTNIYKPDVIVGHSLGGALALEYQRHHPAVDVRTYNAPVLNLLPDGSRNRFSHYFDPISMFDNAASRSFSFSPHSYK